MEDIWAHPSQDDLSAFGLGKLDEQRARAIARHLQGCDACCDRVENVPSDTLVKLLQRGEQPAPDLRPTGSGDTGVSGTSAPDYAGAGTRPDAELGSSVPVASVNVPPGLANHPRYRIVRLLGKGGMGSVYLAEHIVMGQPRALKVISPEFVANSQAVERFRREIRTAARLDHPNIVRAFDAEQSGQTHFLVMEYVEGTDLASLLKKKGPLSIAHACHFIRQAASGLEHAHEHGMVHRDIKPHNLMLARKNVVKILDFGLAKVVSEAATEAGSPTRDGAMMGTPDYMAPEQWRDARTADIRADIYSLGCTLYALLTGAAPFQEATGPMQKMTAHVQQEPRPLSEIRADVPAELWQVVAQMLAKDPARRYQQPSEVARALVPFIELGTKVGSASRSAIEPAPTRRTMAAPGGGRPTSSEFAEKPPPGRADRSPPSSRFGTRAPALAAAALMAVLAAGGVVVRLVTDKGQLVISTQKPGVELVVSRDGKTVQIVDADSKQSITLPSGPYEVGLSKPEKGLSLSADRFTVTRGGETVVEVRWEPDQKGSATGWVRWPATPAGVRPEPLDCTGPEGVSAAEVRKAQEQWAKYLNRQVEEAVEVKTGVTMIFVLVPPGKFVMGSPGGGPMRAKDETLHNVVLTEPYYLGQYEVTQAQYRALTGKNPSNFKGENRPVEQVSWEECRDYAEDLTKKRSDGDVYRLPTEAEWEYACRGGRSPAQEIGVGNGLALTARDANFNNELQETCNVGSYPPNNLGLCDMHGNVWEWCADWYGGIPAEGVTNPSGPSSGLQRCLRGGHWHDDFWNCRSARRGHNDPLNRSYSPGFRLARTIQKGGPTRNPSKPPEAQGPQYAPKGTDPAVRRAFQSYCGDWKVEGDELVQRQRAYDCELVFGDPTWRDYDFSVKVISHTALNGFGVLFHVTGAGHCTFGQGFYNHKQWASSGHYSGGGPTGFHDQPLQKDRWYTLRVRLSGKHCQCLLDDKVVIQFDEERNTRGAVGLRAHLSEVRFRDIHVTDLGGNVLFEGLPDLPASPGQWRPATESCSRSEIHCLQGHGAPVTCVCFSPDGRQVLSASNGEHWLATLPDDASGGIEGGKGSTIRIWDADTGKEVARSPLVNPIGANWGISGLSVAKEKPYFISVTGMGGQKIVRLWEATGGQLELRHLYPDRPDGICEMGFSRDGRRVIGLAATGSFWEWDVDDRKLLRHVPGTFKGTTCAAVAPDHHLALLGRRDGPLAEIDLATGTETGRWKDATGAVRVVCFAADGNRVLTGHEDGSVRLWDVAGAKQIGIVGMHERSVLAVAFSPDGRRAVSGGEDWTVRLWDLDTPRKETTCFAGHTGAVRSVAFSPDGRQVASGSADYTVRLWRLPPALQRENKAEESQSAPLDSTSPVAIQSFNYPKTFIRQRDGLGFATEINSEVASVDSSWFVCPGLAGDKSISLRSVGFPKKYLRHEDGRVKLHEFEDTDKFKNAASFLRRPGLANRDWVSFESVNNSGMFIRHKDGALWVEANNGGRLFAADATFHIVPPLKVAVAPVTGKKTRGAEPLGDHPAPLDCTGPNGVSAADVRRAQEAWAQYLGRKVEETVEIGNSARITFVLVPPGKFRMGSPEGEAGRRNDETPHTVVLTEPFDLGKTEVTQAQYKALTCKEPSNFKGSGDLPAEQVSWEEARDYGAELTKKVSDRHVYRLPTEAEWEYSCRGGRSSSQPFGIGDGRSLSSREANFNGNDPYGAADKGPYLKATFKVDSYAANALGLLGVHGNVWEWCADRYGPYPTDEATNPTGPTDSSQAPYRALRGGGWYWGARACRAAIRHWELPGYRLSHLGFRLARSVPSVSK